MANRNRKSATRPMSIERLETRQLLVQRLFTELWGSYDNLYLRDTPAEPPSVFSQYPATNWNAQASRLAATDFIVSQYINPKSNNVAPVQMRTSSNALQKNAVSFSGIDQNGNPVSGTLSVDSSGKVSRTGTFTQMAETSVASLSASLRGLPPTERLGSVSKQLVNSPKYAPSGTSMKGDLFVRDVAESYTRTTIPELSGNIEQQFKQLWQADDSRWRALPVTLANSAQVLRSAMDEANAGKLVIVAHTYNVTPQNKGQKGYIGIIQPSETAAKSWSWGEYYAKATGQVARALEVPYVAVAGVKESNGASVSDRFSFGSKFGTAYATTNLNDVISRGAMPNGLVVFIQEPDSKSFAGIYNRWKTANSVVEKYYKDTASNPAIASFAHQLVAISQKSNPAKSDWSSGIVLTALEFTAKDLLARPNYWRDPKLPAFLTGTSAPSWIKDLGSFAQFAAIGTLHVVDQLSPAFQGYIRTEFQASLSVPNTTAYEELVKRGNKIRLEHETFIDEAVIKGLQDVNELTAIERSVAGVAIRASATLARQNAFESIIHELRAAKLISDLESTKLRLQFGTLALIQ